MFEKKNEKFMKKKKMIKMLHKNARTGMVSTELPEAKIFKTSTANFAASPDTTQEQEESYNDTLKGGHWTI